MKFIKNIWRWIIARFTASKAEKPPIRLEEIEDKAESDKVESIDSYVAKYSLIYLEDFPEQIIDNKIYIIGESNNYWMLGFVCPCGCKQIIQLNLLTDTRPVWRFKLDQKNRITLKPSVWRKTGCRSHFFIDKSRVRWAGSFSINNNATRNFKK